MPTTRSQAEKENEVGVWLTLNDVARKITRVSGALHSIANLVNDTVEGRPGFFQKFRRAGETSSANARAIWRYHDRRWEEKKRRDQESGNDEEDDSEGEEYDESIDDEVDRRLGVPFSFTRAVEVAIGYLGTAKDALTERKTEMELYNDQDGALLLQAFIEAYERDIRDWNVVKDHLGRCSTYLGESILDSSLRHGWL